MHADAFLSPLAVFPLHAACRYEEHFGMPVREWANDVLPGLRGKRCAPLELEQREGEVLYIPHQWGHAVLNLEPVIGVAQQLPEVAQLLLSGGAR